MALKTSQLPESLFWICLAGSVTLIGLALGFIFDNSDVAKLFGVPLKEGGDGIYVTVAAVRDLCLGVLSLVFTLLRDRRAVGFTILLGTLIPIGDGFVVLFHSQTPMAFLPLHWGGALGCLIFASVLLRGTGDDPKSSDQSEIGSA